MTILSTFAADTLKDKNGYIISRTIGGPAFYLSKALEADKVPYELRTGRKMNVEILVKKNGEFGRIPLKPISKKVKFADINTPLLIISTILDEFKLADLSLFKGKVFLDVQGYVRDGKRFGHKKFWKADNSVMRAIFCLKGTEEELTYIPAAYLEQQKKKVLIITKGNKGSIIFDSGKRYTVKPSIIIKTRDTIGAGDTFFAYVISKFIKDQGSIVDAVRYGTRKTEEFLQAKHKNGKLSSKGLIFEKS